MRYFLILFLFSCSSLSTLAQSVDKLSLEGLSDEQLLLMFDEVGHDSVAAERIARIYLDRARRDGDTIRMARGYDRLARSFSPETNLRYADSVIGLTLENENITYPALGYILKGYAFETLSDLVESTENYLEAYGIAKRNENISQQIYVLDKLIYAKVIWGDKEEALDLQRKRHMLLSDEDYIHDTKKTIRDGGHQKVDNILREQLIGSLQNFAFIFYQMNSTDSLLSYIEKMNYELNSYDGDYSQEYETWITEILMEHKYFTGNHIQSDSIAESILNSKYSKNDANVLFNAFMFSGLSKLKLNEYNSGFLQLDRADSLFDHQSISIQPYKRLLFEKMYEYHRDNNNPTKQIEYLAKLIDFDSILLRNYQYFEPQLIRTIETPQLIAQKQAIINSLDKRRQVTARSAWILGVFALAGLSGLVFYYQRQRRYKQRFEALRSELEHHSSRAGKTKQQAKEISSSVIVEILGKLEQFEEARGYLDPDLNLNTVAKDFGTNAKYLSSVVNLKKGRNFSQYINTLRTEYALARIRNDRLFRRYTIKAIAMEVGFNRAESFSKAFYRRYGIYPSYFIKQLELDADVDTLIDSVETSPSSP